jgi:hypothetical protein
LFATGVVDTCINKTSESGVVDTSGNVSTGIVDTSGNFSAGIIGTSGKFATGVIDTGGAPGLANISANFRKN